MPTMLLPSAISCDSAQSCLQPSALFVSPPASPPALSHLPGMPFGNIMTSCRSLQNFMTATTPPPSDELPSMAQLPTPPMAYAPPPLKLRLRSRGVAQKSADASDRAAPRKRIVKRNITAPRGINKRRRGDDDDVSQDEEEPDQLDSDSRSEDESLPVAPSTPKRARIAPEHLPLGLDRSDFHDVHLRNTDSLHEDTNDDGEWTAEDDRILVELVLEKLKLSKTEWQDCARSLGKDRTSVGRRWKSLVGAGDVGVKNRRTRARLHATWR